MKAILAIILAFSLSGCVYQRIDISDIKAAENFCTSKGSTVLSITANFVGDEYVTCSNRSRSIILIGM